MQMAARRFYAYYIRGKQLALIEHDNVSGSGQTLGQPSLDDIGPSGALSWKSPLATVADGLEIEYAYSPRYFIERANAVDTANLEKFDVDSSGNLRLLAKSGTDWTSDPNLSSITYIVLKNAGIFNGLHKLSSVAATYLVTDTKYAGSETDTSFEEIPEIYYDISILEDESDTIDLPEYLSKALVYYVKAKIAEDGMDLDRKEYHMREFRRILEKHESSKIWGSRQTAAGPHSIR